MFKVCTLCRKKVRLIDAECGNCKNTAFWQKVESEERKGPVTKVVLLLALIIYLSVLTLQVLLPKVAKTSVAKPPVATSEPTAPDVNPKALRRAEELTKAPLKELEANRTKRIEEQFSLWDGSHRGLTKVIKASMNDPDSYKHVDTRYIDRGDHFVVTTMFQGTNAFGAIVTNIVKARVDLQGNVLEILER